MMSLFSIEATRMDIACRSKLLKMLAHRSFRLAETRLSAGGSSNYYIDCRTTTLTGRGGLLTGMAIRDLIKEMGMLPRAVGGMTLGADPVVGNVTAASAWQAADSPTATVLDGFLVRKEKKATEPDARSKGFASLGRRLSSWTMLARPARR